jgi:hypothetical protein
MVNVLVKGKDVVLASISGKENLVVLADTGDLQTSVTIGTISGEGNIVAITGGNIYMNRTIESDDYKLPGQKKIIKQINARLGRAKGR